MLHFFSKEQAAFGLDISGGSLKFMEFKEVNNHTQVQSYSSVDVPKGLMINDAIADKKTFFYLTKQMFEKPEFGTLSTKYCVVSLPESKSFVRVIQIPRMSELEAASAVPFEVESFIPLPLDQVYMDWQIIGDVGDKMNVLIVATPKEFIDAYLAILEEAQIRPVALEVESQSCHRALIPYGSTDTELLVDLDAFRTSLIMVESGALQFTSIIPVAGNTFTESIARSLGVSSQKAESIKKLVGVSNTPDYPNLKTSLVPILNNLSAEIKNILKFHAEHSEKQVQKIILSGGSAKMKNLIEFLKPEFEDMSEIQIELANPWGNVKNMTNSPMDAYSSLGYTTAIGLALRGIEK